MEEHQLSNHRREDGRGRIRCEGDFHPRRVARITHDYANHPLLQIDELRNLANRRWEAGTDKVKFVDPGIEQGSRFHLQTESTDGRSIDAVFDDLTEPGSWVAIYEARTDPRYRQLVDEILDDARSLVEPVDSGMFDSDAYIFISSAPAVTPFHIDRENNFFLQIHGTKRMTVWRPDDREVVPEIGVEGWIAGGSLDAVVFDEGAVGRAAVDASLSAGQGVYVPSTSAHTTRTESVDDGPGYSVSIGVVYYTRATRRRANVYAWNRLARRIGLPVRGPRDAWNLVDAAKCGLGMVATRALALLGRYRRPRGM